MYELEFAPDSAPSQTQQQQQSQQIQQEEEQQPLQEESHLEPVLPSINHSPPPLLLPSSPIMRPSTITFARPSIPSVSIIQHEKTNEEEEEEEENQLNVPSIMAAPLSPAMPLNSTYMAHRSMATVTQFPSTLLGLSTLTSTNTNNNTSLQLTSSIAPTSNDREKTLDHPSIVLAPIESTINRQDQETSMTPTTVQTIQCSVSTQTNDDYQQIHHHCNDVSICPCVQIYTRSEQLFMTSMAVFFRNSINISPSESSLTRINNNNSNNKRQQIIVQSTISQSTPIMNEIPIPIQIEKPIEINVNNSIGANETYVVDNNISAIEPVLQPLTTSSILIDTSTVIHETRHENSKKSDGSSIQININSRNEKSSEEISLSKSSHDQEKFKSLVLTMTALKDEQKVIKKRRVPRFF